MTRAETLRRLLRPGAAVAIPGVPDPIIAELARRAGYSAVYVSGSVIASQVYGLPDIGLVTATESVRRAGEIAQATSLPVIADADTGYGNALNVIRTVGDFIRAGVAGIHLEDQEFPKRCGHVEGKRVIDAGEAAAKIRAAVEARRQAGDIYLIARIDARAVEGFDAAVERARLYVEAGADAVFPEALQSEAEFARFAEALPGVPLIANMTEFGKSPLLPLERFRAWGYAAVIFPVTVYRAMLHTARQLLEDLARHGTQVGWLDRMLTRRELYELNHYSRWVAWDGAFVPGGGTPPLREGWPLDHGR
ncbi:oxaloacetate decarboxylase [Thermaerobacter sp. FW80]|uniref:isocitrate lyase/PEP mutase family protein n=1 Tax=Thermaerobacter sp. FW80 TaxID=2546351 RepID=UPI001A9B73BE|nr:isocitrate lyase/phosphoenolpyruvate mutase family protein [Thermaerobacter sp. FW80]